MKKLLVLLAMLLAINANAQWVHSNGIGMSYIKALAVSGTGILAANYGASDGIYLSSDNGANFTAVYSGTTSHYFYALAVLGTNIFAGSSQGIFISTNNGTNWTSLNNEITGIQVYSLTVSGTNIFAGTFGNGVFLSTNNGLNWVSVNNGLVGNSLFVFSLTDSGTNIFAGTSGGVFLSTNNGVNWIAVNNGIPIGNVYAFAVSGSNIYAAIDGGVYLTTNNGNNWTSKGLSNQYIQALAISGTNIFAGAYTGGFWYGQGIFLSTNNGTNWIQKIQGFPSIPCVASLLINNNIILSGTTNGVWHRSLSEIMGLQNISTKTPSKYSLSQNYPNPFNPTTNIKFSIVNSGDVKLVVYDIQGREVQTLVNESLKPGTYEAAFDARRGGLNSGVYFYKLVTNGFTETKKMLLIK